MSRHHRYPNSTGPYKRTKNYQHQLCNQLLYKTMVFAVSNHRMTKHHYQYKKVNHHLLSYHDLPSCLQRLFIYFRYFKAFSCFVVLAWTMVVLLLKIACWTGWDQMLQHFRLYTSSNIVCCVFTKLPKNGKFAAWTLLHSMTNRKRANNAMAKKWLREQISVEVRFAFCRRGDKYICLNV